MDIQSGSLFVNPDGRTIKVQKITGTKSKDKVDFYIDGSKSLTTHTYEIFHKMLESAGYKDITHTFSGFSVSSADPHGVGATIFSKDGSIAAQILKKDSRGIHVRFNNTANPNNSTTYIYDSGDFDFKQIFTNDLLAELSAKFNTNVFEVIGEVSKTALNYPNNDVKFTVAGTAINKELLDKISKKYEDIHIYSIKRLTSINIP
jgi:hypothetical protein